MRYVFSSLLFIAASIPASATVDTGLLALVPSGANAISGIDAAKARSSPFGQYVLGKMNTDNPGFDQMIQETGFDPRRDVEDVLFVGMGTAGVANSSHFAVLVRGNFDHDRIKSALLSKGTTVQTYQGAEILLETSAHGQHAFAFPDVDIAAMGDLASVQQILANRANPAAIDPTLQQLVLAAGASNDAWYASLGAGPLMARSFSRGAGHHYGADHQKNTGLGISPEALQSILQSSGGISFGSVVQVSFDALTRSPQDATSLVDVVRFGASVVQMQRQKDPRAAILATSLDNMTLSASGSNVHVAFSVPESGLEQLAEVRTQHGPGGAVRPTTPSAQ